jgi:pimeloyl-ACP methyl ester carboxylesterase
MSEVPRLHDIATPDGRTLRVAEAGPPDGLAVVTHHGTPGAGLLFRSDVESALARGIRLIAYDRPGYGHSSPSPGRTAADAAADVATILDALEIDRFATYGASGGGPHALACAALLPGRCAAAVTLAGVGPFDAPDLDWIDGMGEGNVAEFEAARAGRDALIAYCEADIVGIEELTAAGLREAMAIHLSEVDAAVFTGEVAEFFLEETTASLRQGVGGWVDDDLAFLAPWGFDVAAIQVPVLVWQGQHDLMVPVAHGEWLGHHVAGAEWRFSPEDGHLTLSVNRSPEVHDWLLERLA